MSTCDSRLRIGVISDDPALIHECRVASEGLLQTVCEPTTPFSFTGSYRCDVCVWDYRHNESAVSVLANSEHTPTLIVAESAEFSTLRETLPDHALSFLLPPATAASMRPFLEHATIAARREISRRLVPSKPSNDRDWTMQRLLEANLLVQRTNQQQTIVLARSIHHLRCPLIALQGYCDLLMLNERGTLSLQQMEIVRNMYRSLKRLCVTVSALDMGLYGEPALDVISSDDGLQPYVDQIIEDVLATFEEKRIDLSVQLDPTQGTLRFNPSQIEYVLLTLLENACRSTPREGAMEVLGYSSGTSNERSEIEPSELRFYRIDIRDSGPRILAAMLPLVFDEFPSDDEGHRRNLGGLGLATCRMILAAHKGALWADSDATGTTFSLCLPYERSPAGKTGSDIQQCSLHHKQTSVESLF
jgi:two-component system, OmpR family, sensor histidine kinase VanS